MNTNEQPLYEGKAKRIFPTADRGVLLVEYKNSLTAFNAQKKASLAGKGELNNKISSAIFGYLKEKGLDNHFVKYVDETHQLVKSISIIPVEVVVRNIATGSIVKRLGVKNGLELPRPLIEYYYKDDALGDPIITSDHAILFGWATEAQLRVIDQLAAKANTLLSELFKNMGIILVDFKLEFGLDENGNVLLGDEVSPDTCRFWDSSTREKFDKDLFREDSGDVLAGYREIWKRLCTHLSLSV